MNRFGSFVAGLLFGVVGLYITMHFSLVRASDGFHIVPKIAPKMEVPFTDVRNFTPEHWMRRQSLALSILKANKGHLLQDQALLGFRDSTQRLLNQFSSPQSPALR